MRVKPWCARTGKPRTNWPDIALAKREGEIPAGLAESRRVAEPRLAPRTTRDSANPGFPLPTSPPARPGHALFSSRGPRRPSDGILAETVESPPGHSDSLARFACPVGNSDSDTGTRRKASRLPREARAPAGPALSEVPLNPALARHDPGPAAHSRLSVPPSLSFPPSPSLPIRVRRRGRRRRRRQHRRRSAAWREHARRLGRFKAAAASPKPPAESTARQVLLPPPPSPSPWPIMIAVVAVAVAVAVAAAAAARIAWCCRRRRHRRHRIVSSSAAI